MSKPIAKGLTASSLSCNSLRRLFFCLAWAEQVLRFPFWNARHWLQWLNTKKDLCLNARQGKCDSDNKCLYWNCCQDGVGTSQWLSQFEHRRPVGQITQSCKSRKSWFFSSANVQAHRKASNTPVPAESLSALYYFSYHHSCYSS